MADTTTLATFRVDNQKWEDFKAKAKEHNLSASAVLIRFIDSFLTDSVELPPAPIAQGLPPGVATIDQMEAAIAAMEKRLLGELEKKLLTTS